MKRRKYQTIYIVIRGKQPPPSLEEPYTPDGGTYARGILNLKTRTVRLTTDELSFADVRRLWDAVKFAQIHNAVVEG